MFVIFAAWLCFASLAPATDPLPRNRPIIGLASDENSSPVEAAAANVSNKAEVRYVAVEQVHVYAGPGEEFYPTSVLQRGQAVEVYAEVDGWLAIRPPQGSFSWLPAAQGLLLPGGRIVEVTDKLAVSWIGSSLGTAKQYRWQVQLARGEQLAVIGEKSMPTSTGEGTALWYKIAPPNGEYRWLQQKATATASPDVPPSEDTPTAGTLRQDEPDNQVELVSSEKPVDSQVVQANALEPINAPPARRSSGTRDSRNTQSRSANNHTHQQHSAGNSQWDNWHAIEFQNGSLSFPGIARMFGLQPKPSSSTQPQDDPFDLTAAFSRAHKQSSPTSTAPDASDANRQTIETRRTANDDPAIEDHPRIAARQSQGWRDPRQLREMRMHQAYVASASNTDDATQLFANSTIPIAVDDQTATALEMDSEIGTGVIPANAYSSSEVSNIQPASSASNTETTQSTAEHRLASARHSGTDTTWHGIAQAPTSEPLSDQSLATAELSDLQIQLSQIVAGPEATWNLLPLAQRTRYFIEHGSTAQQRGEARLLLERIDAFASLAQRAAQLNGPTSSANPASSLAQQNSVTQGALQAASRLATPLGFGAASEAPSNTASPQFDGTGWLVPVHTSGHDMPTHALTNDQGKIIVYLTAAPGVNLNRFDSQPIGVYGLRGYLPQLKSNHIQVQRIVRLR